MKYDVSEYIMWVCFAVVFIIVCFHAGVKVGYYNRLEDLCYKTNGKYDFCQEKQPKKEWEIVEELK